MTLVEHMTGDQHELLFPHRPTIAQRNVRLQLRDRWYAANPPSITQRGKPY